MVVGRGKISPMMCGVILATDVAYYRLACRMGRDEYPKTLKSTYNLAINWKGDTKGVGVTPNDGVSFTTESERAEIHAKVKMTQTGKPVICHICGKNYATHHRGNFTPPYHHLRKI